MVQLEEVTEDVAAKLRLKGDTDAAATATPPAPDAGATAATPTKTDTETDNGTKPAVAGAELPPALAFTHGRTSEEILADLNKSPLFMTEMEEDNDGVAALQALAYEGTPLENATDFKDRGNESFRTSRWADARTFYDKGVALLVGEDRRRARGDPPPPREPVPGAEDDDDDGIEPDSPEDVARQHAVLGQLYSNRAACQLALHNYRACTLDCGAALRLDRGNTKAWYRSAKALLALDKTDEAAAAVEGGRAALAEAAAAAASATGGGGSKTAGSTGLWDQLAKDVAARAAVVAARQQREADRVAAVKRRAQRLRAVLRARGVRTRATAQPPEMEDAVVRLEPDDDDGTVLDLDVSRHTLCFPTLLLYPLALQSDLVKAFNETETLADHLAYILPPPWAAAAAAAEDGSSGAYANAAAVDCYMETRGGTGLVRVGKKMALGRILAEADVEVVDDLVRVFVVPRAAAADWVREFKEKRAAERGER